MRQLQLRGASVNNPSWQIGRIQAGVFWLRGSQQEPRRPQTLFVAVSEPTQAQPVLELGPIQLPAPCIVQWVQVCLPEAAAEV